MKKLWISGLAVTALLLGGGCSLQMQTTAPAVKEYRMQAVSIKPLASAGSCDEQTMKVSLTLSPDLFKSRQIHYADSSLRQYTYTRARWAESPVRQLRHMFEAALAQSGLYKSVVTYNSQVYNDLYFEPKINNFMQYFKPDGSAYVHVDMELTLMDQDSNRAISTLHINKTLPCGSADASGAVKAFNTIVQESLDQTIGWLHDVCKRESLPAEKRGQ
ncbi:MAG: ABC-type transport auxiliary lipoprotein family protein [Sulfurimonadaceae bacterium]|nr:ABC-type transport auxiliary lipoprotein family protein [Sulfurimonadaceae bacterium]